MGVGPTDQTAQLSAARAVLASGSPADADRHDYRAIVALVLPGKDFGIWTRAQPVHHLPGVWLANRVHTEGPLEMRNQRDPATAAARAALKAVWQRCQAPSPGWWCNRMVTGPYSKTLAT